MMVGYGFRLRLLLEQGLRFGFGFVFIVWQDLRFELLQLLGYG